MSSISMRLDSDNTIVLSEKGKDIIRFCEKGADGVIDIKSCMDIRKDDLVHYLFLIPISILSESISVCSIKGVAGKTFPVDTQSSSKGGLMWTHIRSYNDIKKGDIIAELYFHKPQLVS